MSAHKLRIETGRYGHKAGSREHRICEFCCDVPVMELLINLPSVDPIIEDEIHFLRTCPRYHLSRTNIKEPTKSVLLYDTKSLFLTEHVQELTRYTAELFRIRFPPSKKRT